MAAEQTWSLFVLRRRVLRVEDYDCFSEEEGRWVSVNNQSSW